MRKTLLLVGALAVSAVTTGLAFGAIPGIPGANGMISACFDKQSGQLRIYNASGGVPKGCGSKEEAISWNQQGADGEDGEDGLDGAPGLPGAPGENGEDGLDGVDGQDGARGPSDAFAASEDVQTTIAPGGDEVVVSLDLPAGSFFLAGSTLVVDDIPAESGAQGTCGFEGPAPLGGVGTYDFGPAGREGVVMNIALTLDAPAAVPLRCRNNGPSDVVVRFAQATAIQVETLTNLP